MVVLDVATVILNVIVIRILMLYVLCNIIINSDLSATVIHFFHCKVNFVCINFDCINFDYMNFLHKILQIKIP